MLFYAHSGLRYLVLLAGVLVLGYAGYGQATKREYDKTMRILRPTSIRISRIASGIPVGSHLEYADQATLARALEGRREL